MKNMLKKIFNPNKIIGFILFNFGAILQIYVFSFHLEDTWLAYISYLLSTYALIIFIVWFYKACFFSTSFIKEKSRVYKIYQKNQEKIIRVSMITSLIFNLLLGISKLIFGIYYKSAWFITFAAYYLLLCFIRTSLFKNLKNESNLSKQYKKLKQTGIILFLLDIILSGMIILIIHQNQTFIYKGYLIYLVALYDFYLIINAFINVFKYRKQNNPILISSKCINLTVAMISMISLEVAMIYEFGSNDSDFKLIMTSCTGFGVCLINSIMALYMIIKANIKLKINKLDKSSI